ncbi:MAG: UDP-N-acetylmuramoyl-tripeptide--D-alanyl-D-alanine ligase [Campylobacterales bacterium]|nr:UDP-N-acetylmuramoyl-tripeptide--D-alanyl-D-alanine ligase [Campylobacterales bacterium]
MADFFWVFTLFSHIIFSLFLGHYLILNLQWYHYKIGRVVYNHKKPLWHIIFFMVPIVLYYGGKDFFWIFFYFIFIPYYVLWYKKQDKKLALTGRVKRFFTVLLLATFFQDFLCLASEDCQVYGVIFTLFTAFLFSDVSEKYLALLYRKDAKKKLQSIQDLKVVAITASFGKTSIKNYLYEMVSKDFKAYKTPRSVNTEMGIIADINNNLPNDSQIYIVEAGARLVGDIAIISSLLEQQYVILGEIGEQHIEYFKTLENIKNTKREIFRTPNLKKAIIHETADVPEDDIVKIYSKYVSNIKADLNSTNWDLQLGDETIRLETKILGSFNAYNISCAVLMALELGVSKERVIEVVKNLPSVEHRLQKIEAGGKVIIDDSFNGNLKGMLESVKLAKSYEGRKVIVTPGIVESNEETNKIFAKAVDEVFDLVLITGSVNFDVLKHNITPEKSIRVFDKTMLEKMLGLHTKSGDLIIFANDTPTFL